MAAREDDESDDDDGACAKASSAGRDDDGDEDDDEDDDREEEEEEEEGCEDAPPARGRADPTRGCDATALAAASGRHRAALRLARAATLLDCAARTRMLGQNDPRATF